MFVFKYDSVNPKIDEPYLVNVDRWANLGAKFIEDKRTRSELNNSKKISILKKWRYSPMLVQPLIVPAGLIYRINLGQDWTEQSLEAYCAELNEELTSLGENFSVTWSNNIGKSRRGDAYEVGCIYVPASAANDVKMAWSAA